MYKRTNLMSAMLNIQALKIENSSPDTAYLMRRVVEHLQDQQSRINMLFNALIDPLVDDKNAPTETLIKQLRYSYNYYRQTTNDQFGLNQIALVCSILEQQQNERPDENLSCESTPVLSDDCQECIDDIAQQSAYIELAHARITLLTDALYSALPYVEDHVDSPVYKTGVVANQVKQIKDLLEQIKPKTDDDLPF